MRRIVSRTGYMILILVLSSIAVFYAIRLSGGDATAAALPASTTAEQREAFRERLGLTAPIYVQYFEYAGRIVRGDLGNSLTNNADIGQMLIRHGKNSLVLGAAAFVLVFAIGIPLGIWASVRRNRVADQTIMTFSVAGMAIPNFWLALLAIWLFASTLHLLPSAGCCELRHLILPAAVLAFEGIALTVRMTRSAMLENLGQDWVRTTRAAGLSEIRVIGKHAFRNALIPIISLAGLEDRPDRWLRPGGRDHLRMAGTRPGPRQCGTSPRLPGGAVLLAGAGRARRHRQLAGGPGLCRRQSAAPSRMIGSVAANPVLSLQNLTTTIHSDGLIFDVVRGLSLDIYPNEIVCLVGESGCGKTVAALSVMRLLPEAARDNRRQHPVQGQRAGLGLRAGYQGHPGRGDLDDLPGSAHLARPIVHRRKHPQRAHQGAPGW